MLTLEQIAAMPDAGRVLLATHRILTKNACQLGDAFDVIATLGRMPIDDFLTIFTAIGKGDDLAVVLVGVIHGVFVLDRAQALSLSTGLPVDLPYVPIQELLDMNKKLFGQGGAT